MISVKARRLLDRNGKEHGSTSSSDNSLLRTFFLARIKLVKWKFNINGAEIKLKWEIKISKR